ncbi:nucleotidyltransferase domain-containing protein [Lentzea alba]|uniref:hypothetical protein n=1 Tax=Lentzea alba TaxID=2714351 RepID=UPI0039BF1FA1
MDLTERWPVLGELIRCAATFPGLQVWVFGSTLRSSQPNDLDVLVIYQDRAEVDELRKMGWWEISVPPMDIIAMTEDEEQHYGFITETGAACLHPLNEAFSSPAVPD